MGLDCARQLESLPAEVGGGPLAVDTEADSFHHYPEKICLIQISMGSGTSLIDPLAGVDLTLEDFDAISRRTPHIGDLKPFGRYHMVDLDRIGGVPVVLRALYDEGLIHGEPLTVTGQTMGENLEGVSFPHEQDVVRAMNEPVADQGGIAILRGSLAPGGAVVKIAGVDLDVFEGTTSACE